MTVRDTDKQQQNVDDLSRDVEHANNALSPIFDKEKEQNRLREAQLIGEIGSQVSDVIRTQGQIIATKAANEKMQDVSEADRDAAKASWQKANPGKNPTAEEIDGQVYKTAYDKAFNESGYGTGGKFQQAAQAATAAIQGLAGGDMSKALAGASAPYLAEVIHNMTTDPVTGKVNTEANLMAHAVLGAVVAQVNGNSALAGASGAAMGEYIAQQMYPGINREDLTEEQRQTISALGTLAAGLAGGVVGNSTADAVAGAQAGKNAVENNFLLSLLAPPPPVAGQTTPQTEANAAIAQKLDAAVKEFGKDVVTKCLSGGDCPVAAQLAILAMQGMIGQDESGSNPNIGKDLTDEQKKELGGSGSGTGTPPPPENDPKQQNEKPVDKLNQKQESSIRKIDNAIKHALKDHDIAGTLKDMDGNPVPKKDGGYWDHMQEMQNTLRGLRNHADTLKNVNNPEAQAAYGRATDAINKIESALKGHGI
ncbi:TPA: VENN motif pre-toxin domain-containing protein [Yersinia enterocolitica]|nr:VENN motif pre-toxin domain-containing protein [Yersinia enterocolitica]